MSKSFQVRRFVADTNNAALQMVKREMGDEAVILSTESIDGRIHILAAPAEAIASQHATTQHAQKTANALSKLKQARSAESVNPYFFNPVDIPNQRNATDNRAIQDKRFTDVAISATQSLAAHKTLEIQDTLGAQKLEDELKSIKKMMTAHFGIQHWNKLQQEHVIQSILYQKLVAIGFDPKTVDPFISKLHADIGFDEAWISVLNDLVKNIRLYQTAKSKKTIHLITGPSGAGKTTLLAKFFMQNMEKFLPQKTAIIFISQNKLTTVHEAKSFKNVFNLPCFYVETAAELAKALEMCEEKSQIYVDLPSPNILAPEQNVFLNYFINHPEHAQLFYVLPGNSEQSYLNNLHDLTKQIPVAAVSITKIDEHCNYIPLIDFTIRNNLPLAYLNTSPVMTERLIEASKALVIRDLLMIVNQFALNQMAIDHKMAQYLMEKMNNDANKQSNIAIA